MKECDVVIVGGGLVGYLAALSLASLNLNVIILESKKVDLSLSLQQDGRAIALAYTSCILLKHLSLWENFESEGCPIEMVHVSEQGAFGKARIRASDMKLDYLGHVVPAPVLGFHLANAARSHNHITEIAPVHVNDLELHEDHVIIDNNIKAKLILACDGEHSALREKLKLNTEIKNHHQQAIVANINITKSHENTAFERFTELGTLALLPLKNQRMTSVLTANDDVFPELGSLNDADYLKLLQRLIGKRLGELSNLGKRFSYPLQSLNCNDIQQGRFILMGNAAHTVNPIAAQGLNLAIRDIAVLIDVIKTHGLTIPAFKIYAEKILPEQESMFNMTERLVHVAQSHSYSYLRSLGLITLDYCVPIKNQMARRCLGLSKHRGKTLQAVQDVI